MSILIRGMEMPESCDDCPHPTCTLWQSVNGGERNEKCPIVPVPPHGRLIDADDLQQKFDRMANEEWNKNIAVSAASCFDDAAVIVEDAPTIIEREE